MATSSTGAASDVAPLIFPLGDFELGSGEVLPGAFLAYRTFGDSRNPAIVNPTCYAGWIQDHTRIISESNASLNPAKYFIVVPALLGGGESCSPSNSPGLRARFPAVTFADNVRAQHRLLTEKLGVSHLRAVVGFSMGGAQAYQWAVQYPDFMDAIVPICTSARTAVHNNVFLEGVKSALVAARGGTSRGIGKGQHYPDGSTSWTPAQQLAGLSALGRVYAGWGFSQAWYRERLFDKHFGYQDVDDFIRAFWVQGKLKHDPDDMLAMLQTWQLGDISAGPEFGGDIVKALRSIKARVLVAPGRTDLYFPPEDSEVEVASMPPGQATLAVIPSIWGHWAGGMGESPEDWAWLDARIGKFFEEAALGDSA